MGIGLILMSSTHVISTTYSRFVLLSILVVLQVALQLLITKQMIAVVLMGSIVFGTTCSHLILLRGQQQQVLIGVNNNFIVLSAGHKLHVHVLYSHQDHTVAEKPATTGDHQRQSGSSLCIAATTFLDILLAVVWTTVHVATTCMCNSMPS